MSIYAELTRSGLESHPRRGDAGAPRTRSGDPDHERARRLNALSAAVCVQLNRRLAELTSDPELRTIVLTGAEDAFSAEGDLTMMGRARTEITGAEGSADVWRWIRNQFGGVVRAIARMDKAVIAAVNGPAAGVGLAFALTCDIAIASERAPARPRLRTARPASRGRHELGADQARLPGRVCLLRRRPPRRRRRGAPAGSRPVVPPASCCQPPTRGPTSSRSWHPTRSRWRSRSCARPPI